MKTLSHYCNQEKRLSYCERNPTPPIWVELHTLYLPAGRRIAFVRRNHGLGNKTSTQDEVSKVSDISPRVPETFEPRKQSGVAVKGNSKVTFTRAELPRACYNRTHAGSSGPTHRETEGGFLFPLPPWFIVQPAPTLGIGRLLN